jgi:hypothetical protein
MIYNASCFIRDLLLKKKQTFDMNYSDSDNDSDDNIDHNKEDDMDTSSLSDQEENDLSKSIYTEKIIEEFKHDENKFKLLFA